MQRRALIKQLVFVTGAALVIPSCLQDKSKASILLDKITINGDQENMLAELSETIIPKTDTPGAKDMSAHLFALMMVDDCFKKEDQQKFMSGFKEFEAHSKKQFDKSFVKLSQAEKESLLTGIEQKKIDNPELTYFYSTVKKLTIQAYSSSEFFLTKVQVYELIPGRYNGCVPVKNVA